MVVLVFLTERVQSTTYDATYGAVYNTVYMQLFLHQEFIAVYDASYCAIYNAVSTPTMSINKNNHTALNFV